MPYGLAQHLHEVAYKWNPTLNFLLRLLEMTAIAAGGRRSNGLWYSMVLDDDLLLSLLGSI